MSGATRFANAGIALDIHRVQYTNWASSSAVLVICMALRLSYRLGSILYPAWDTTRPHHLSFFVKSVDLVADMKRLYSAHISKKRSSTSNSFTSLLACKKKSSSQAFKCGRSSSKHWLDCSLEVGTCACQSR